MQHHLNRWINQQLLLAIHEGNKHREKSTDASLPKQKRKEHEELLAETKYRFKMLESMRNEIMQVHKLAQETPESVLSSRLDAYVAGLHQQRARTKELEALPGVQGDYQRGVQMQLTQCALDLEQIFLDTLVVSTEPFNPEYY